MLMLVSLQNGELNQITFLCYCFFYYNDYFWCHLLDEPMVSTTTIFARGDVLFLSVGVHWVYVLQSTLKSTIFEGFIICFFVFFKYFSHGNSLFILWFQAWGICFNINLEWLELMFM